VLYPDSYKCIFPAADRVKGLNGDLGFLNEVRLTEEKQIELDEMQAYASVCIRSLLSVQSQGKITVLTNLLEKWNTNVLDFARGCLEVHNLSDVTDMKRLLHEVLETAAKVQLEGVITFQNEETEEPATEVGVALTPAVVICIQMQLVSHEMKCTHMSLYVVDVLQTTSIEFQLCFGVPWLGFPTSPQGTGLFIDLQTRGHSLLCTSPYNCEAWESRPYPSFYICVPGEVEDGSFLLKQICVREHLRCIDRLEPCSSERDLGVWVSAHYTAKAFNPVNYSNHYFEYVAGQCLAAVRTAPVQAKPEIRPEVKPDQVRRTGTTLDRLASLFESVSTGRKSGKPSSKFG
jgi:hypothetical protein